MSFSDAIKKLSSRITEQAQATPNKAQQKTAGQEESVLAREKKFTPNRAQNNDSIFDGISNKSKNIAQKAMDSAKKMLKENSSHYQKPNWEAEGEDKLASLYLNDDGTMLNDFNDLMEGIFNDIKVDIDESNRMASIDYDGDGKADQEAKYDKNGKKSEEWFDSNGDGKLDTGIGYDEDGKATWIMADTNYDGSTDLSEDTKQKEKE